NRGIHVYIRLEPRWDSYDVRRAAVAAARELGRRHPDTMSAARGKEERGGRGFIAFNQNAPHRTGVGAWSDGARGGAPRATPLYGEASAEVYPDELAASTLPGRIEANGGPWADMTDHPKALDPLLAMYERDRANGLMDAPWPPVYPKPPDEPPRVAPSRA